MTKPIPASCTRRKLPAPLERDEQAAIASWLDLVVGEHGWCHVPNGGSRHRGEAARLTSQGVKAGVPDLLIFRRSPTHPEARGIAIEMKRRRGSAKSGKTIDGQRAWALALEAEGWITTTAKGWDEARAFLETMGFGRIVRREGW